MKYNTYTLDNGLRIIHLPSDSKVVYCGYQINAGTRNEEPGEEGLAHFCEHVTFKGTERRKAWHILNCLESVGGDLNAYTNKEGTVYYSAILKEHIARAVDLLSDIVFHSVYPQAEIDKEVEVICDEIESYNDSPAELIYDEFENILFKGSPLGHNILGTAEQVRAFKTEDALRFTRKLYRPDNAIFFAYGDIDFKKLVKLIQKALGECPKSRELACSADCKSAETPTEERIAEETPTEERITEETPTGETPTEEMEAGDANHKVQSSKFNVQSKVAGQTIVMQKNTHQAHVMIGTRAYDVNDDRRMPLYLLNNMLGGPGMNAKLNLALREHNGLVYTVESTMVSYGDTGTWSIYFGCDEHDVKRCLRLVRKELDKFMLKPLSEAQLKAAKKQIKGQIGVACDNRENFALDFGKSFLHYGWEKNVDRLYEQVDEITAAQIQAVAQELFDKDRLTTLIFK
ncbi:insulinase family protein [Prevotella copri]|uniref:Insulinase family protein n=1 Tax=Segatella copri TaxID=165179 RepID=A0AAW5IKI0_9BACT|nr:pitrilysin family protein [Segatella copri]MCP9535220.1 insulinase family protein [Segatella copri]MCP9537163.1 insulinase family protein [Segatella copri]MCP9541044.1 insulinase family protein [Segatella copri]MCP9558465.1 insulinase family protein [Segatella copri]MCP9561196.1 insulinase family protein [Segatella copri]